MKVPAELREVIAARVNSRRHSLADVVRWLAETHGIEVSRMAVSKIATRYRPSSAKPLRPPPRPRCPTCGQPTPPPAKAPRTTTPVGATTKEPIP